jgi:hypothetical protein
MAALLLVAGILIGVTGYYVATNNQATPKTNAQTTTTQTTTITQSVTLPAQGTALGGSVSVSSAFIVYNNDNSSANLVMTIVNSNPMPVVGVEAYLEEPNSSQTFTLSSPLGPSDYPILQGVARTLTMSLGCAGTTGAGGGELPNVCSHGSEYLTGTTYTVVVAATFINGSTIYAAGTATVKVI